MKGDRHNGFIVSTSLPRFYFGSNGRLIKSPEELKSAYDSLMGWLERSFTTPKAVEFTRVDLCWQFSGNPKDFIASCQNCKHPLIRGLPLRKPDETLLYGSKNGQRRLRIYDKEQELRGRPGRVTRVEVALFRAALRTALNGGAPVTHLDYGVCSKAFREFVIQLTPKPCVCLPRGAGAIINILALGEQQGWSYNGQTCAEIYAQRYTSPQTAARFLKKLAAAKVNLGGIDWNALLPISGPPEPVEIL